MKADRLDYASFCQINEGEWAKVVSHDQDGVKIFPLRLSFDEIWTDDIDNFSAADLNFCKFITWKQLRVALPDPDVDIWGYAMTYSSHREEVDLDDSFFFRKYCRAESAETPITFRPYLDYETEIGLLMDRENSNRFGYLIINDLTDRGIQARNFNPKNMGPGFTQAKSFTGGLHVGSLLVIGDRKIWPEIEIEFHLNDEKCQHLKANECLLHPQMIHQQIFAEQQSGRWSLALTGTTGGVQFSRPSLIKKLALILCSGLSKTRATEKWLNKLSFLKPGDRISFKSDLLGYSTTTVINST